MIKVLAILRDGISTKPQLEARFHGTQIAGMTSACTFGVR